MPGNDSDPFSKKNIHVKQMARILQQREKLRSYREMAKEGKCLERITSQH
jgi:hypothetical protein